MIYGTESATIEDFLHIREQMIKKYKLRSNQLNSTLRFFEGVVLMGGLMTGIYLLVLLVKYIRAIQISDMQIYLAFLLLLVVFLLSIPLIQTMGNLRKIDKVLEQIHNRKLHVRKINFVSLEMRGGRPVLVTSDGQTSIEVKIDKWIYAYDKQMKTAAGTPVYLVIMGSKEYPIYDYVEISKMNLCDEKELEGNE